MGTQPWRLFRSSNSAVIADENLPVTPHATDDKTVTITANLKSARFGGYYETCKDNSSYADVLDTLKKLAGEEVSVTVTVVSTANQAAAKAAGEKIDALFPVTKDSADAINEASGAYKSLTDAAKKLLPDAEEKLAKAEADYKKAVADAAQDQADRDALIEGLLDGTIDMLITDHAPHSHEEKSKGLEKSAMGVVGLETSFAASYTHLVKKGILPLEKLVELMHTSPMRRFGCGTEIAVGQPADLTVFDLNETYTVDPEKFLTMGRATPFTGTHLTGACKLTMIGGEIVWKEDTL